MSTQLHIHHRTSYKYAEPVKYTAQALRLTPRRELRQRTLSWTLLAPGRRTEQIDAHGNVTHLLTLEDTHSQIEIVVSGTVEVAPDGELIPHEGALSPLAYLAATPLTAPDDALCELASRTLQRRRPDHEGLYALAQGVFESVRYKPGVTSVEDSAAAVLARGEGVCQDQAHVFIACCRAVGIPARYVSGYLYSGAAEDAASHAWADVWLGDDRAWLGIDITHLKPTGTQHCRLAVGRDYLDAAPIRGVRRGGGHEVMDVNVSVVTAADQ